VIASEKLALPDAPQTVVPPQFADAFKENEPKSTVAVALKNPVGPPPESERVPGCVIDWAGPESRFTLAEIAAG
jgi:hypothetical protein